MYLLNVVWGASRKLEIQKMNPFYLVRKTHRPFPFFFRIWRQSSCRSQVTINTHLLYLRWSTYVVATFTSMSLNGLMDSHIHEIWQQCSNFTWVLLEQELPPLRPQFGWWHQKDIHYHVNRPRFKGE